MRNNFVREKAGQKKTPKREYSYRENRFRTPKTNSWFSSLYEFPSSPLYVYPGAYRFAMTGFEISVPTVSASSQTVFGSFAPQCTLNFDGTFLNAKIDHYGYWDIAVEAENENFDLSTFYISQGSPFVYIQSKNPLRLNCQVPIQRVKNGFYYEEAETIVFVQAKDALFVSESEIVSNDGLYRTIILPKSLRASEIISSKWEMPRATDFEFEKQNGKIITKYENSGNYYTLWPHQASYLAKDVTKVGEYNTQLGKMALVEGNSFSTILKTPNLRQQYQKVENRPFREKIKEAIQVDVEKYKEKDIPEGVYFRGKDLGTMASLAKLADLYSMEKEKDELINLLAAETKDIEDVFYYDGLDFMYKSTNPEFGHELGADHHFHYGYYLYALSTLVEYRPSLLRDYKKVAENMIFDIANFDFSDKYPNMRSFSVYEGHSWADPYAKFADGNNQESTSEALNVWYAIWLWGKISEENEYQDLGEWLFANELAGTKAYWFGNDNPFPKEYERKIASIVWGGKRDFTTWFSAEPMHIYGIQILPLTPASLYLDQISRKNLQIDEIRKLDPNVLQHEWADLFVAYLSFVKPEEAVILADDVSSFAGTTSKSIFLQVVYENYERRK